MIADLGCSVDEAFSRILDSDNRTVSLLTEHCSPSCVSLIP